VDTKETEGQNEAPPVDPGCLPAWKMGEMPAPAPYQWRNILALIGPGLVLAGSSLGTGEWVIGAAAAALTRGALLWVAPMAILCQLMLNTEAMRYTLLTGEPVFTGFLRTKPGPRFWLVFYFLLDCMGWWPTLAGLTAQIIVFAFTRQLPDPNQVRWLTCGLLILAASLLCFGGRIYNTLEWVLGGKVFFVLGYMLIVTIFFVPFSTWMEITSGMFNPFRVPKEVDWGLVAAVAGLAGIGGMGNILASNYVREKGWGMGAQVGAIASAVGGQKVTLSHLGTMARPGPDTTNHFRQWWGYIARDQYGVWVWGSLVGMLLPCLLGAEYLKGDYFHGVAQSKAAAAMASDFGAARGDIFTTLTLLCGFVIMFPGQFSSMDGIARRWCDALWSGSERVRRMDAANVKYIYYTLIGTYVSWGIALNALGISPPRMMMISANLANLSITCCILHTLYVNTHLLPVEFRPPMIKRVGMLLAATFYTTLFSLMTYQIWPKVVSGELFRQ